MQYYNNPFVIAQQQQQEEEGGIDPIQVLGAYQQLSSAGIVPGLGGGAGAAPAAGSAAAGAAPVVGGAGAAGSAAGGAAAGSAAGGAAAGGAAAGGAAAGGAAGGFASGAAAAGPWAALAAVIIANEVNAYEGGYREEDPVKYAGDLLGGKVLEQDLHQRWLPGIFGKDMENDFLNIGADTSIGADLVTGDFGNAWDTFTNDGLLGQIRSWF